MTDYFSPTYNEKYFLNKKKGIDLHVALYLNKYIAGKGAPSQQLFLLPKFHPIFVKNYLSSVVLLNVNYNFSLGCFTQYENKVNLRVLQEEFGGTLFFFLESLRPYPTPSSL